MAEAHHRISDRRLPAALLAVAACLLASLALSAPAHAAQGIEEFTTTVSTAEAGGHPDLGTSFRLQSPGAPEVARNIVFDAPEGVYGNPSAATRCASVDFALEVPAQRTGRADHGPR